MHAVAVKKGELTIGHMPRFISSICSIFFRRITGERQYSADLPQGGLEVPCILTFETSSAKECDKTQRLLKGSGVLPGENYSVQQQNEATDTLQGTCRQQVDLPVEGGAIYKCRRNDGKTNL